MSDPSNRTDEPPTHHDHRPVTMADRAFYGEVLAAVHHEGFTDVAAAAAGVVLDDLDDRGLAQGRIIDLGSGSGALARTVSEAGHRVLGVDLSPAMVDLARRTVPSATFRCGSIHDVDLPPADIVTAIGEVAGYAADPRAGLASLDDLVGRVRSALTPGGLLLFDLSGPGRAGPDRHRTVTRERDGWFIASVATESADHGRLDRAITVFVHEGDGRHRRVDEHHALVLFDPDDVMAVCRDHGFTVDRRDRYGEGATASPALAGWSVFAARAT